MIRYAALASISQIRLPGIHELTPPVEQVRPGVGRFDSIWDSVGQGRLHHRMGSIGLLSSPVAEARKIP